jgi:phosphohistidine phosphatase
MDNDQVILSDFSPKELYLLRHSDAELTSNGLTDFSRKLSNFGKQKVRDFSMNYLAELEFDLVLCSNALRTKETLSLLEIKKTPVLFYESLYLAEKETILSEIEKVTETISKLLIVGHNNGLSELITYLTGKNILLSTCQLVEIQLEIEKWEFVGKETGNLLRNFF